MVLPAPVPPARRVGVEARRVLSGTGLVLAVGVLAGCGASASGDPSSGPSSPLTSASSSTTPVSPGPSGGAAPSASASPRPSGLAGRLLGADHIPGFGGVSAWTIQSTGPAGPEPSGVCQEYDFATIGARSAVVRSYLPAAGGHQSTTAAERVVAFPDATNTARAGKVLASFRDRCQARLKPQLTGLRVSPARQVSVEGGTASAYTATWHATDSSGGIHTQEVGTVLRGSLIAVVTLEADTSLGSDPMPAALAAAARLLG